MYPSKAGPPTAPNVACMLSRSRKNTSLKAAWRSLKRPKAATFVKHVMSNRTPFSLTRVHCDTANLGTTVACSWRQPADCSPCFRILLTKDIASVPSGSKIAKSTSDLFVIYAAGDSEGASAAGAERPRERASDPYITTCSSGMPCKAKASLTRREAVLSCEATSGEAANVSTMRCCSWTSICIGDGCGGGSAATATTGRMGIDVTDGGSVQKGLRKRPGTGGGGGRCTGPTGNGDETGTEFTSSMPGGGGKVKTGIVTAARSGGRRASSCFLGRAAPPQHRPSSSPAASTGAAATPLASESDSSWLDSSATPPSSLPLSACTDGHVDEVATLLGASEMTSASSAMASFGCHCCALSRPPRRTPLGDAPTMSFGFQR
mmetsp:Transcript_22547/g.64934  ORF Transcript_22547/g.64934 Transcript_22547/m.64934 type:complete len:377 (-) Transcript_22547:143-1273(-)